LPIVNWTIFIPLGLELLEQRTVFYCNACLRYLPIKDDVEETRRKHCMTVNHLRYVEELRLREKRREERRIEDEKKAKEEEERKAAKALEAAQKETEKKEQEEEEVTKKSAEADKKVEETQETIPPVAEALVKVEVDDEDEKMDEHVVQETDEVC